MKLYERRFLSAWLGIFAMCLITFAPLVSQLVVSARANDPASALCSATLDRLDRHAARDAGTALSACAYCDLLTTHIAIPAIPPRLAPTLLLSLFVTVLVLSTCFIPSGAFPSGRPRDPPAFS